MIVIIFFVSLSRFSFDFSESSGKRKMMSSRHRPLLACTVSILTILDIASRKLQDLDGPLGSTSRRVAMLAKFASPLVKVIEYQWFVILLFFDYLFLAIEKMAMKFCPSASHLFDRIEEMVVMIVSLPEKVDDKTVEKFPAIIYQFSVAIRQWALVHLISWLNCLISTLNQMEPENTRMKEIMINNRDVQLGTESDSLYTINDERFCSAAQCFPAEKYKEVEKISEQVDDDDDACEGEEEDTDEEEKEGESIAKSKDIGRRVEEDPILRLFDSTWLSH